MKTRKWPFVYVGIITVITYLPILITVIYSFNASKISSVWEGFSLKWYAELFRDRDIRESLVNSLVLAGLSSVISSRRHWMKCLLRLVPRLSMTDLPNTKLQRLFVGSVDMR